MTEKPIQVFFSYSHRDEEFKDELVKHLSILQRRGVISGWHDRKIVPGREWNREIDASLSSAEIVLLMVSADFLASDYCWGVEVQKAMQRHDAEEACVIPVVLRWVDWASAPFAKFQALPRNAKPIASWSDRDEAFYDVARGIAVAVEDLRKAQQQKRAAQQQAAERMRLEAEERQRQQEQQARIQQTHEGERREVERISNRQDSRTQIIVAVIGLLSAVGVALVTRTLSPPAQPLLQSPEVSPSTPNLLESVVFKVSGETCPPGSTLVTYEEALENVDILRKKLDEWDVARLANGGSMSGSGYKSKIRQKEEPPRPLGNALCKSLGQ